MTLQELSQYYKLRERLKRDEEMVGGLALSGRQADRAVAFSSACLEKAVRAELDMPAGEITYADLEGVPRLAPERRT